MRDVVIVSGCRTAIGAFGGSLKEVSAVELGTLVIRDVLKRAGLKPVVDSRVLDLAPRRSPRWKRNMADGTKV